MLPRAFPLPLAIGTDICQISRIYRILAGPRGPRFVSRVLSVEEQAVPVGRSTLLGLLKARSSLRRTAHDAPVRAADAGDPALLKAATFMAGRYVEAAEQPRPCGLLTGDV